MNETFNSKELGLVAGVALGRFFFKTEDLHYGYWTEDLEPDIANLKAAQQNYTEFLISHIPPAAGSILDVGSGAGTLAAALLEHGFRVDCVSPSALLSSRIMENVGERVHLYRCHFEDLLTDELYDLVVFCESFQYIPMKAAFDKSMELLKDGGWILISDYFQRDVGGGGVMGGGHRLASFYDLIEKHNLVEQKNIDITSRTAPTLFLWDTLLREVGEPLKDSTVAYLRSKFPLFTKFISWKFKKRLRKIDHQYFSNISMEQDFRDHKTYRFLLYQKK